MTTDLFADAPPSPDGPLTEDLLKIVRAMALLWSFHPRTTLLNALRLLGYHRGDGRAFTAENIKELQKILRERGLLLEHPVRQGYYRLAAPLRGEWYRKILARDNWQVLERALYELAGVHLGYASSSYWRVYDRDATVAIVRLNLLGGAPVEALNKMKAQIEYSMDWYGILKEAVLEDFDPETFVRIVPEWRWSLALEAIAGVSLDWNASLLPIAEWALAQATRKNADVPRYIYLGLAEMLLNRGQRKQGLALLEGLQGGASDALRAFALAQEGRWSEAQTAFEAAIKLRQSETGARKRIFPESLAWIYPLCLLAQQTPKHLELARKFCLSESGKRTPDINQWWGLWVHAIGSRLGETALNNSAFIPYKASGLNGLESLWRILLAAWLGSETLKIKGKDLALIQEVINILRRHLTACGFDWLIGQLDGAQAILENRPPPAGFFIAGQEDRWRDVLAALQALSSEKATTDGGTESTRLVWVVHMGKQGEVKDIESLEQKRGPRGWNKAKAISLGKVAANANLPPWDAKVARAIRQDGRSARQRTLDKAAAIQALIGHPAVVLAQRPEQFVDLAEGSPEIEVIKKGKSVTLKVTPPLRDIENNDEAYYWSSEEKREAEALRLITLREDSAQRVSVIRMSAAQRRAAQLLAGKVEIPASAEEALKQTLHALSSHFQVHADHVQAAREIAAESRLRAELSPAGDGLFLRIVATPLGENGPRLSPGMGRKRLMAAINGETVGAARDLVLEQSHLDAVLDALPFLDDFELDDGAAEWDVSEPEDALAMVEILPTLPAIYGLDWPKGKPVRVMTVDTGQLAVSVKSERDWFRISGQAQLDEGLVLDFAALLDAARSRSRFIPLGNGAYVALTKALKERLADLAAVMESDKHGARLPHLAAAWVDEALQGAQLTSDTAFRQAIARLQQAQEHTAALPHALQAELRPYQEDGYVWASRLAQAGFGACLADDMGLGKTLQALALLLARAEGGPALVIAPTSVCGNWLAEALRFAPSLKLHIYGEGERETVLGNATAFDVVVVSYTLLQQAGEAFAAKAWHTVIADEAQAFKNAAAKRSQAVFNLQADFRLALSGTPVENRLADLWSIMRFVNPGLLGTLPKFNERFANRIERDKDRSAQHLLRRLIGPFLLRRTKTQVLQELPPRTELIIEVEPDHAEAAHYEALRRQAILEAEQAMTAAPSGQARMNILAQLTRLRRAACDPRLTTKDFPTPGAKVLAFAELATELVANGHKVLVFSQFVDFLGLLRQPLDAAGIAYQYLDGATPAAERTRRVAAFQGGEGDLFLISLKAGGFGLNLTAADYVVITDPWWNPAAEDQAMGRAHRMGQQRPVTVYRLVRKGTLEEQIVGMHHDKRALAESILSEGDAAALPSTDELIALIRG
ncbi:MAG: DEAD/DEAH box helicase [Sulfurimicrobium sp.]|nr:DEAD/DEAH box helicase [Sulfurimicrobium sp.]